MGYYVNYYGTITIPNGVNEGMVVQKLKDLNHRHDLKTGGQSPKVGDPYEDTWFAWLPAKYHEDENLKTVEDILDMLGFAVTKWDSPELGQELRVQYDSKTGAEEHFLQVMAQEGLLIDLEAEGEDGAKWHYITDDNQLLEQVAEVSWSAPRPVSDRLAQQHEILKMIATAFVTRNDE